MDLDDRYQDHRTDKPAVMNTVAQNVLRYSLKTETVVNRQLWVVAFRIGISYNFRSLNAQTVFPVN